MAIVMTGMDIRAVDSNDDVKKIGVWGNVIATDYAVLAGIIDAAAATHGLKVVGRTEKYLDETAAAQVLDVPAGKTLVSGSLIVERATKGPVYLKGKFPNLAEDLNLICQDLVTGVKTIGGSEITGVIPRVNTGTKFTK